MTYDHMGIVPVLRFLPIKLIPFSVLNNIAIAPFINVEYPNIKDGTNDNIVEDVEYA